MLPLLLDNIVSSRTFCSFSFQHVPLMEWTGRNISEGRTSSILWLLKCYISITTTSNINILYQSVNGSKNGKNGKWKSDQKESDLCEGKWRTWQTCREKTFQRIHNECTVSLALRETYVILVNSTHRLEFVDFPLTLNFNHYQRLQFLVARKLLSILVDDHKIIGKFRLERTLGGL